MGVTAAVGLTGCGSKSEPESKPGILAAAGAGVSRLNLIFHGIFVFQVTDPGILVYVPKSNVNGSGAPVHSYKIRVTSGSGKTAFDLPEGGFKNLNDWTGFGGAADRPTISPDSNFVLNPAKNKQLEPSWAHAMFKLKHPNEVLPFRTIPAAGSLTDPQSELLKIPATDTIPIVFSYLGPASSSLPVLTPNGSSATAVRVVSTDLLTNVHIHAEPESCPDDMWMDHFFINSKSIQGGLSIKYKALAKQPATINIGSGFGITADDLKALCEMSATPEEEKRLKSRPPNACFSMFI
jgi:hypothetical protein